MCMRWTRRKRRHSMQERVCSIFFHAVRMFFFVSSTAKQDSMNGRLERMRERCAICVGVFVFCDGFLLHSTCLVPTRR